MGELFVEGRAAREVEVRGRERVDWLDFVQDRGGDGADNGVLGHSKLRRGVVQASGELVTLMTEVSNYMGWWVRVRIAWCPPARPPVFLLLLLAHA
jgi:hypothetical protein